MKINKRLTCIDLDIKDFGSDFHWGVSTAAYQIEGGHNLDDKGISIWDAFTSRKRKIYRGQNGNVAVDFYHRYQDDIDLMKRMGIKNFRFSISWSRVLPDGTGSPSKAGIDFYNRVINYCLQSEIIPWVTLYHWDLPQKLEEKGGWTNRKIIGWFEDFTRLCAVQFGDRVQYWMVLNEPMVFTGAGYFLGVHAPGRKGLRNFLPAAHHAVLCQAAGGRILRSEVKNATIGTTFSCSYIEPDTNSAKDSKAAKRADALLNRFFVEPALGLGYPIEDIPGLQKIYKYVLPGDVMNSIFDFDFIGIQNYTREIVKYDYFIPYLKAKIIKATKRNVRTTLMDWEVYPLGIYEMIKKFNQYKNIKKILITENGAAFHDVPQNNTVEDVERIEYLQQYLQQVLRAKKNGFKINGYFVWTFVDNFEWAEGYYPRFGLVYVDFESQQRIIKASGKWLKSFLTRGS